MLDEYWKLAEDGLTSHITAYEKWKTDFLSFIISELLSYKDEKLRLQAFEVMLSIGEVFFI